MLQYNVKLNIYIIFASVINTVPSNKNDLDKITDYFIL